MRNPLSLRIIDTQFFINSLSTYFSFGYLFFFCFRLYFYSFMESTTVPNNWHTKSIEAVVEELNTSLNYGLTESEVLSR